MAGKFLKFLYFLDRLLESRNAAQEFWEISEKSLSRSPSWSKVALDRMDISEILLKTLSVNHFYL